MLLKKPRLKIKLCNGNSQIKNRHTHSVYIIRRYYDNFTTNNSSAPHIISSTMHKKKTMCARLKKNLFRTRNKNLKMLQKHRTMNTILLHYYVCRTLWAVVVFEQKKNIGIHFGIQHDRARVKKRVCAVVIVSSQNVCSYFIYIIRDILIIIAWSEYYVTLQNVTWIQNPL